MADLVVELDGASVERLRSRARREGVELNKLASRLLAEASDQDPFEFVGSVHSGTSNARRVDDFLAEHGFGSGS